MTTPKMRAYVALVAAARIRKKFEEENVKRDSSGKFAKKAGTKVSAPTPPTKKSTPPAPAAKKSASTPPPVPGKKMTNKLIYGKQPNGTIMETTDGQHRMVYNAAGNNWTFQERTPDGGWKVIDILGKAASYQKAQELSQQWGPPHTGTPDELTPVPGPDSGGSGSFAPGWNVVSDPSLTSFKKMQILTMFKSLNNTPNVAPGTVAVNTANIAQTYGVDPETVLALVDQDSGNTNYSDMVQQHLNGNPFPDPMYPSPAKKTAAAKKLTSTNAAAKKAAVAPSAAVPAPAPAAAPTPTVAPSPSSPGGAPSAPTPPAVTYTAADNPYAQWINSAPVDLDALADQVALSTEVANARENLLTLTNANASAADVSIAAKKYNSLREKYANTYGTAWSPNHHTGLVGAYAEEAAGGASSPLPDGTPIPGLPPSGANIVVGSHVMMQNGTIGVAVGPGVGPGGESGVDVKLPDGTTAFSLGAYTIALKPEYVDQVKNAPPPGANVQNVTYGPGVVTGPPKANPQGVPFVPVTYVSGTTTYAKVSSLTSVSATPSATPPAGVSVQHAIGTPVSTPNGPGYVSDVYLPENEATVTYPDGTKQAFTMDQLNEIDPSLVPKNTTPTPPPGFPPISNGTTVSTPAGVGKVVNVSPGGAFYKVQLTNGSQVEVLADDVAEVTPTSPPPPAHVPPTVSGLTYDANGVPQLSSAQHAMVSAAFQNAGVNWYNPSDKLFDAAYEASQTTGLSIEDVLKFADANFHNFAKDGGKPIQTKIEKWAKSTKGKQHIQAKLGSPFIPTTTPAIVVPPAAPTTPGAPSSPTTSGGSGGFAALPGANITFAGVSPAKQTQAYTQFTAGVTTLNDSPGILAQKAADVAKNVGMTPEQVLAIVDAKKAAAAGVPNGNLFTNKVLNHMGGKKWPKPTPASTSPSPGATYAPASPTAFPTTPGYTVMSPTDATQLQSSMVAASTPLTASQAASLKNYTSSNYAKINGCLRFGTGCTPTIKNHIAQATAGMRPTTQNITTFRGTGLKAFGVDNIADLEKLVGKSITEPGFSSTSISSGSAFGGQVAMQIDIPAGTPGSYVGNISHYKSEKEFVLPPGTKFRVLEVKPASGGKKAFVRVEVVPA